MSASPIADKLLLELLSPEIEIKSPERRKEIMLLRKQLAEKEAKLNHIESKRQLNNKQYELSRY